MTLILLEVPGLKDTDTESQVDGSASNGTKYNTMIICDTFGQDCELEMEVTQNARRTLHVPKVNNMTFERKMDLGTFKLLRKMLLGQIDKSTAWVVHCLRSLGDSADIQKEFLTIELLQPILSKHTLNISEGDTTEQFEINAVDIKWSYQQYDEKQDPKGKASFQFNTLTGKCT